MLRREHSLGSARRSQISPAHGDRFIPNRANMNTDLCRASVLTAEKRRLETIGKAAARHRRKMGDKGDDGSSTSPRTSQPEPETRLQAEFHRRMKAALFDVPLDRLDTERRTPVSSSYKSASKENSNSTGTLESIIAPNLLSGTAHNPSDISYLAYASLPELEAEHDEDVDGTPTRRQVSESSLMSFSSDRRVNGRSSARARCYDPYDHDQLHVLQRASAKSSYGSMVSEDPTLNGLQTAVSKIGRRIPTAPTRILDAPDLVDDYYLNLISWSKDNILAVALGQSVYLWNASSGDIQHLVTLPGRQDYVTSVCWSTMPSQSKYIAIGTNNNAVQLWDSEALNRVRTLGGHCARVSSLAWNQQWLSSGGRDSIILQHDVRASNNIASRFKGHTQEVCGLKWNEDGTALASGGNENYLCIWDAAVSRRNSNVPGDSSSQFVQPRLLLTHHKAAVKALAWCPFRRDLLASGGGTADRTIKFWNSNNGIILNSIDTGSQVCSLLWSQHQRELVSSHGFSENQLILWQYPTMTKVKEFKGHTSRVLNMEMGPGGQIVSAAADETLRFWDIFGPPPNRRVSKFSIGDFQAGLSTIR
jgi:cell division cycle protein 20 (cofactor of APC complex)